jgi:hypothetical protein
MIFFLEFDCVHINKTYFLNKELFLYFFKFGRKVGIFNTKSVFYSVNLQLKC